ncbi:MAG: STAS domain-containing protein [Firmicutes bacterium]|nr:STAS domain-containing protein [Bacillota bacterium]
MLKVKIAQNPPHVILALEGELDMATGSILEQVMEQIESRDLVDITFSLDGLNFIDSTGIGQLIGYYKVFAKRDIPVSIDNNNAEIEEILALIGVREIMGVG